MATAATSPPSTPARPLAGAAAKAPVPSSYSMASATLAKRKAQPRKPGEASFFFYESHFRCDAVKIMPGEYFVANDDLLITTTLGSCIAACLWDRQAKVGGMNHFMLSDGDGSSGRYGGFAMELLINELLKMGATRQTLEAKVFGGGAVISGMNSINVGERNTHFAMNYLATERIPVVSKDVMDVYPRKVCFIPSTGKAMVKRLAPTNADALVAQERAAVAQAPTPAAGGGSIDLF